MVTQLEVKNLAWPFYNLVAFILVVQKFLELYSEENQKGGNVCAAEVIYRN